MGYTLSVDKKKYFGSVLLLEDIVKFNKGFPVLLEGDDELLEPLFIYMMGKGYVDPIGSTYKVTENGEKELNEYLSKLENFRSTFKVFCSIDLDTNEIAYERFFDFSTDAQFYDYLGEYRFEDLRVPICKFKEMDPVEMVFLDFVDSGVYDFEEEGWQAELVTGIIWDELLDVCNSSIDIEEIEALRFESGYVEEDGSDYLIKLIKDCNEIMIELNKRQHEIDVKE